MRFLDESIRNIPTTSRPYSLMCRQHDLTMFGTRPSLRTARFWLGGCWLAVVVAVVEVGVVTGELALVLLLCDLNEDKKSFFVDVVLADVFKFLRSSASKSTELRLLVNAYGCCCWSDVVPLTRLLDWLSTTPIAINRLTISSVGWPLILLNKVRSCLEASIGGGLFCVPRDRPPRERTVPFPPPAAPRRTSFRMHL